MDRNDTPPLFEDRFEFYKELYFFELERKDRIGSGMATPLAVIFALVGATMFFIHQWPGGQWSVEKVLLLLLLVASVSLLTLAIGHFRIALFGTTYGHVSTPTTFEAYWTGVLESGEGEAGAARDFTAAVRGQIVKTTTNNFRVNNRRVTHRLLAYEWMLRAAVALAFTMIAFKAAATC